MRAVKYDSATFRSVGSCRPQAERSWCARLARTRLIAMRRCRQSTSSAPEDSAISRARSRRSRSIPSGSLGLPVIVARIRSSSTPRSFRRISARFGTVKNASSWCALVSFWFTLAAMSPASARTWASSIDSMTWAMCAGRCDIVPKRSIFRLISLVEPPQIELLLVEAEVVADLVDERHPDLLDELLAARREPLEVPLEED